MAHEQGSEDPARNPDSQPSTPVPTIALPEQSVETNRSAPNSSQNVENNGPIVKELHWVHHATFWTQVGVSIIGIIALIIYGRQLGVMHGTLAEMKRSGEQSTEQVWSAIGNINWMARTMDQSSKDTLAQIKEQTKIQVRIREGYTKRSRCCKNWVQCCQNAGRCRGGYTEKEPTALG